MFENSYNRLIDLAKRTGDRLIIHDPIAGRDVVIMDIDEYEMLIDERDFDNNLNDRLDNSFESYDFKDRDVRKMSGYELLDQINRDIAKWRADKEMEERWEREKNLEDEIEESASFDPFFEGDGYSPEWHSAGDVMSNRYKTLNDYNKDNSVNFENDFSLPENSKIKVEEYEEDWEMPKEFLSNNNELDDIKMDAISDFNLNYDALGEEGISGGLPIPEEGLNEIPYKPEDVAVNWLEEPLEENEPVFYEEPV